MFKNYSRKKVFFLLISISIFLFFATSCESKKDVSISFKETNVQLTIGDTSKVEVDVHEIGKYTKEVVLQKLDYSSSDDSVVEYQNGNLVAKKVGTATITATWQEVTTCTASMTVEVKAPSLPDVTTDQTSLTLGIGDMKLLSKKVTTTNDFAYRLKWTSKDQSIATVDDTGKVTGIAVGTTTIELEVENDYSNKTISYSVTVYQKVFDIIYVITDTLINTSDSYSIDELPHHLKTPTRDGYTFEGWFDNPDFRGEAVTSIESGATSTKTFYAKWEKIKVYSEIEYVISDDVQLVDAPTTYLEGTTTTLPIPTREKYRFVGWFIGLDGVKITEISEDYKGKVTVYAKWEKILVYSNITYVLNGGTNPDGAPLTYLEEAECTLPIPTKDNYDFIGWYLTSNFTGAAITEISITQTGDVTVYAKWEKVKVYSKINYVLNGGVNASNAPTTYLEGVVTPLLNPTREGYKFIGWYMKSDFSDFKSTKISTSQTGDVTFYASWEEIIITDFTITYSYEDGALPTHVPTSVQEFADEFWKQFYAWSKSKDTFETFKNNALTSWGSGNPGTYKVYFVDGRDKIDEGYFINSKANYAKWIGFMNAFDEQVTDINGSQNAWSSAFVGYVRLKAFLTQSASYWNAARNEACYQAYLIETPLVTEYHLGDSIDLVNLVSTDGRDFLGWYDADGNKVTSITPTTKGNLSLTAKWSVGTPVTGFTITNQISKLLRLDSYQLTWSFTPADATNKKLGFTSSNTSVATIDENGKITAVSDGTTTISIIVKDNEQYNVTFDLTVYIEEFIDGYYETETTVEPENDLVLIANLVGSSDTTEKICWKSLNEDIATVNDAGVVTGVKSGYAIIKAYSSLNESINLTFGVTIISLEDSDFFRVISKAHNKEIYVTDDLFVGYAYHTPVYVSASDLLFNYEYSVNNDYQIATSHTQNRPGTKISQMEFITVHYTAGTNASSTGKANAQYFQGADASANYCVGNDGIYCSIPDGEVAYHAGDGTKTTFTWTNTGVKATSNTKPVWGVVKNSASSSGYYFTLNGTATKIVVPTTGTTSSGTSKTMVDPAKCFTYFGPAWKIVDGTYYMGTTWACFTQTLEGRISSRGGNNNSVGIETACNYGSDLWYTYQITAQLIARLLDKYNLDTTRVVGHNMFSGKDCPQTLLANNGELWVKFMECVEAENDFYQQMKDYTISCKSNNPEILSDNGRIISIPKYTTSVSYTVTVTSKTTGVSKTATFSSVVHGIYA
jgi:uncharacterized repeat protein (TIGR02543 family)